MFEDDIPPGDTGEFTPAERYPAPVVDLGVDVDSGWILEDDRLPVESGGLKPKLRYPNPPEVDGVDVTPDRPPVDGVRFSFVKLVRYPGDAQDIDVSPGVDVTPGRMLEDDIPPVDTRRFTSYPNPLGDTPEVDRLNVAPG